MPRHSLGPDELPTSTRRVIRLGAFVVPRLAIAWLWLARALVAAVIVVIVLCRVTGTTFASVPPEDNTAGPFLPQFALVICLAFGIASPYILLPLSFASLSRRAGPLLHARTVFGPRTIDLRAAKAFSWSIPSRSGLVSFVTIIGRPGGALVLSTGGTNDEGYGVDALLAGTGAAWPAASTPRHLIRRILLTIVAPSILFAAFCFTIVGATLIAALGT